LIDLNTATYPPAPAVHYDLDAIVARLRATAETWVPRQFRNGRRVGDEWRLANIRGDAPRKNGSCVIALKGERAGDWHEFDGGDGGGPLSALEASEKLSGRELFAYAAELVGWVPNTPARVEPVPLAAKGERDPSREIAFILEHAVPIAGAPAAAYLASRGLESEGATDLLAHHDLTHWEMKAGYPAVIGVVRNPAGEAVAVHRTYLQVDPADPDKVTKAAVPKPRMMLGKVAGGAVRLAPIDPGAALGLCEGIETGLAVMTSCPGLPVWATLSATNLEQVKLPSEVHRIVILADHDASGAGTRAAETAARRLRGEGRQVVIAVPPREGSDFNDVLLREGREAVAAIVGAAFHTKVGEERAQAADATGRHLPIGFTEPAGSLPTLRADEGDLARAVDRAWSVLLASNRSPWVFRAGGLPSWVVPDDEGRPMVALLTEERLRHILAKLGNWRRMNSKGDLVPAHPPTSQVKSLLATPDPALPVLAGIVTTPVFGRAGVLLTEPGYHADARLLYQPIPGFQLPTIPEQPTAGEVTAARSLICDDLLGEFPFTSLAERAHAVSLLLLGFLRAMIEGPTPLHLIEKPTPGTGATLMVDAISTILTGSGAGVMTEGTDEEEWRKRITAKLRQIPTIVLIDNLKRQLDASALAAALTAPFWEDRVLGVSEITRLPIRCLWIATGNNPTFSNEMARRLVRIRLDAHVEQPWQRSGFRHPDLMVWVVANRARLVAACLTLCRAWLAAGRPRGTRAIGSYESWSQIMGGVLEVAGIEGFLGNLDEMMEASDSEGSAWRGFVSAWWVRFGTAQVATSDLYELAQATESSLPLGVGNDRAQRTRLGKALGRMRDRVFKVGPIMVRIDTHGTYQGAQRWKLSTDENMGGGKRSRRSPDSSDLVNVEDFGERGESNVHENTSNEINGLESSRERGERRERFLTLTHARTRAHMKEGTEKRSRRSPRSPDPTNSTAYAGERGGERSDQRSPIPNPPAWLEDVP
jgi:putative DNA primase/helicase